MGTVSFEVPGPGTYQVQCDPSLAPLANPAAAGDVLAGKRFYNDQTQAVTGTIPTKSASDVTADGPLVAVPPGYYPQAVNKTVSDPDLVPGNIKAGVDIFGVTGSLTSSFSAVLVVTVDSGAEVTATDGTTTLTATSTGTATFQLPNGGTWTVSATLNGSQAAPATVEVQENFSLALSAGATQTVNIPTQYEAELSFTPSRLPDGYTEVEYIHSDSACSIDTGTPPVISKTKITLDICADNYVNSNELVYGAPSNNSRAFALYRNSNTNFIAQCIVADAYRQEITKNISGERLTIECDLKNNILKIGDTETTAAQSTTNQMSTTIRLFSSLKQSYNMSIRAKLYSCQIYNGDEKVRDLVPCINPSNVVGLYDIVGNSFYSNNWTGTLTAGPAV